MEINTQNDNGKSWLENNQLAYDIWNKKYKYNNESFDNWLNRISGNDNRVKQLILDKKFLFGGRILANRGLQKDKKITFSNCYVIPKVEDNIESIYNACAQLARTYSYGGGCGIDISNLRPKQALVNNAAKSTSGAVSFMTSFDTVTKVIGQNGRRGALMISIDINHPDVPEFVDIKTDLEKVTSANISVRVSDEFMRAVENDEDYILRFPCDLKMDFEKDVIENLKYNELTIIKNDSENTNDFKYVKKVRAKELFDRLCENNWNYAEPGILYWDRIANYNLLSEDKEFEYAGVNPCISGDTLVKTDKGDIKMVDLLKRYENGEKFKAYSYNTSTGNVELKDITNALKTRENANLIELELEDGSTVKLTPDHKVFTENRGYVEAGKLTENDVLIKIHEEIVKKIKIKRINIISNEDVYDITVEDNHNFFANNLLVHNCAEEPLPAGGSCLLGSLNLSEFVKDGKFDFGDFRKAVEVAVVALNDVLDEGLPLHPLQIQRDSVSKYRQIGLGIFGYADMLIKLKMRYGTLLANDFTEEVGRTLITSAIEASAKLAKERGAYDAYTPEIMNSEFFKRHIDENSEAYNLVKTYGLRNSQLLTIAPTGTLSTMLNVSGGAEPIFAKSYTRTTKSLHDKDVTYTVYPKVIQEYLETSGKTIEMCDDYIVSSENITPEERVRVQGIWQKYIDASISSTVNLPKETTVEDVRTIYMNAWKNKLKGVTVFRAGCARIAILQDTKTVNKEPIDKKRGYVKRPKEITADYHQVKIKGETFIVLVGFVNDKPYEIFAYRPNVAAKIPNHQGKIIKVKKNHYSFKSELIEIPNLQLITDNVEEKAATLYTSMLLRHNTNIKYVIKTAKKVNDNISSFSSAMCRILSKYMPSEDTGDKCPDCGSNIVRENGCLHCDSCGWSKCE